MEKKGKTSALWSFLVRSKRWAEQISRGNSRIEEECEACARLKDNEERARRFEQKAEEGSLIGRAKKFVGR